MFPIQKKRDFKSLESRRNDKYHVIGAANNGDITEASLRATVLAWAGSRRDNAQPGAARSYSRLSPDGLSLCQHTCVPAHVSASVDRCREARSCPRLLVDASRQHSHESHPRVSSVIGNAPPPPAARVPPLHACTPGEWRVADAARMSIFGTLRRRHAQHVELRVARSLQASPRAPHVNGQHARRVHQQHRRHQRARPGEAHTRREPCASRGGALLRRSTRCHHGIMASCHHVASWPHALLSHVPRRIGHGLHATAHKPRGTWVTAHGWRRRIGIAALT